ncbi:MAG TPA: hypothetical protein VKU02_26155 [Gemmataceae bacterium]|nr:hypothetical protein [Gemmataceae bacterium]
MKYAGLGLVAVLVGVALSGTQPVSGQATSSGVVRTAPEAALTGPHQNVPWGGYYPAYGYGAGNAPDPELGKLVGEESRIEHETATLVDEYSRTEDESQRGKIKAKLAANLEKEFELQQKRRDLEVARIEAQLKKLREIMRKRGEARQTIIDKRLDQLLREADGLGWTPPHGTPTPRSPFFAPSATTAPARR